MSRGRGCGDSFLLARKHQILLEKKDKSKSNRTPLYVLDIHLYIIPYIYQHRNRRASLSWFCFFFQSVRQRHFSLQLQPSAGPPSCQSCLINRSHTILHAVSPSTGLLLQATRSQVTCCVLLAQKSIAWQAGNLEISGAAAPHNGWSLMETARFPTSCVEFWHISTPNGHTEHTPNAWYERLVKSW